MTPHPARPSRSRSRSGTRAAQRGAALLTAMIIVTLVATLAASMVWQQWRSVQVESAERARAQANWILMGALDYARLILREDGRAGGSDHLGEPWSVPLAEARLSSFLSSDRENNTDSGPEAFLSGSIEDAQSRFNLRNLTEGGVIDEPALKALTRLCESSGVASEIASQIATGLRDSTVVDASTPPAEGATGTGTGVGVGVAGSRSADPPLPPNSVRQLRWLGIDPQALLRLERYVTLLPEKTAINLNTASREVIAAVLDIDLGSAERIVSARQRSPLNAQEDLDALVPPPTQDGPGADTSRTDRIGYTSKYFYVQGRLRLGGRIVEERSLVERRERGEVVPLRRERVSLVTGAG